MKKILFTFLALSCLAFTSCFKESEYTITYTDTFTDIANLTVFEYDGTQLVQKREIKMIVPNTIYELTSSDLANQVVIGVEAIVGNKISEWYASEVFKLDNSNPTHITVSFINMATQDFNPINPDDCVSHYLSK
ncbi:MAG: hypothetical protein J5641_01140 [Bacteroidales bacterium]|nr:hypothetical protein [Bacteroidales bacterium]